MAKWECAWTRRSSMNMFNVIFTKLDANSDFWPIRLSETSRHFTTFITPWGRFCFNVLPYGISSGSEKFQKCISRILEGLNGAECNIDDVPVHAPTRELHNKRLGQLLERLATAGVTLNIEKCVFRATRIKFLGNQNLSRCIIVWTRRSTVTEARWPDLETCGVYIHVVFISPQKNADMHK